MSSSLQQKFINFLQNDLAISNAELNVALRRQDPTRGQLHMVLWQHGLISINQLNSAFEWLEQEASNPLEVQVA
ncbi:DUF2949 domain-containing protein [Acaryochloris sp. 'Moss Beach']|uniref:DUF2949 domain-containing protein n=1 Tax=Acaryochloris TaxID=155977 RepID=UPI001BB05FD1|nr:MULTISPECIES: DUF2949 domain-containing protein [Acaryochloris]QUY44910.1 DUF2949 domain-containing protein [Acaryochloris marina S15]UJB69580.1 DUF2949 domain-containing protein [Acaryochloris sp. 'Moss Beach']